MRRRLELGARTIVTTALGETLGAILVHVAVVGAHAAAAYDPQPVGAGFDQMPVVADEDDRALVVVEGRTSASRASTSRWLVGSSRISRWPPAEVASANSSRAFSPPDRFSALVSALSRRSRTRPTWRGAAPRWPRHQVEHVLVGRLGGWQVVHLVLREIADLDLVEP
jgi:hypothetical protein